MISKPLERCLEAFGVAHWWADELYNLAGKRRPGWSGIADVAVSRKYLAISTPRSRRAAVVNGACLHELAHLLRWVQTGKSPSRHNDDAVCADAITLAHHFGFGKATIDYLVDDFARVATQLPIATGDMNP